MNDFNNYNMSLGSESGANGSDTNYAGDGPAELLNITNTHDGSGGLFPDAEALPEKETDTNSVQVKENLIAALIGYFANTGQDVPLDKTNAIANAVMRSGFLNTYEVDMQRWDRLGTGACGLALPLRHRLDHSRQYLKIIPPNPKENYNFSNEYSSLRNIDNDFDRPKNIVALKEYDVRELSDGSSVAMLLMEELEPLAPIRSYKELLKLATDVCVGLVYLQRLRVIHRDIKPLNIMRRKRGSSYDYVIIDLGLLIHADENGKAKHDGILVSHDYAPGELSNANIGDVVYDFSTDLYMLGVTLLCMITDSEGNLLSCLHYMQSEDSDFTCDYLRRNVMGFHSELLRPVSGTGVDLERIIEIMCSNRPSERPADADTLLSWLTGESAPVSAADGTYSSSGIYTEYNYPISEEERSLRNHWISADGLIDFPDGHKIFRRDFDYCRIECDERSSLLAQNTGQLGILVNRKIPQECGDTVTAFDVTVGSKRYILRCIKCTDEQGTGSSSNYTRNRRAYFNGMMQNVRYTCVDKILDTMYVIYRTDHNGGYQKGRISKKNHYLFTLSETYAYNQFVSLEKLIEDYGDDYDHFSVAERCAICYKVIKTMNELHSHMIFHGSLAPDRIYVLRRPDASNSPEVKIAGLGCIVSNRSEDNKALVRTLMSTLTNNVKIPLEILPVQTRLREYFIELDNRVNGSGHKNEPFTIELFNEWYEATYKRSVPVAFSPVSDGINFVGNENQPLANYTVTILKETQASEMIGMNIRTFPYTILPVLEEWGVVIRLFVRKDYDGALRLYATCLDHSDRELLINDQKLSQDSNGDMLMDGTRITCTCKGLFGRRIRLGQITVISPQINY